MIGPNGIRTHDRGRVRDRRKVDLSWIIDRYTTSPAQQPNAQGILIAIPDREALPDILKLVIRMAARKI